MWNIKTEVISVIIGATGTIKKPLKNYLNMTGKHIKTRQKTAIFGTVHILQNY